MRKIKLMADYGCFPLWDVSDGVGNINPNDLPLSPELKDLLMDWAKVFDQTLNEDYPPDSGFESQADELEFKQRAAQLAWKLREELGPEFEVLIRV